MDDKFIINNIHEFTDRVRGLVYNNFGKWSENSLLDEIIDSVAEEEIEDFNRILSHDESVLIILDIVKKQTNKYTKEIRYVISEKTFINIVEKLNHRMVSNIMQSLANKGLVETAFDSDIGDFIFWVEDEQEKPETD